MKRLLFLTALLIPLSIWAQENQTIRAFKAEKLYVRGLELYQNGDVRGAIQTFDQVIALDRNHAQVYQAKGDAFFELGDYDEAIESYAIAAQQYPDNASIRNSLGVSAAKMGMYRAAESYFLEALQIDPNLASARRNLEKAQIKVREGSNPNDIATNTWDDSPIRPTYPTNTTTNGSGWGEPWPETTYPSTPYPTTTNPNNSADDWTTGFSNQSTTTPPVTPVRGEPALPWERPDRDPRQTTFSRDRGQINVAYRSDPFVQVDQIRVTENSTLVSFLVQSISRDPFMISLQGPGSPGALMITDRQFGRSYRLKNVRLDGWPQDPYELRPGENKLIIAEFERIPTDMYFFHIIEGESENSGSWDFYDVELVPTP